MMARTGAVQGLMTAAALVALTNPAVAQAPPPSTQAAAVVNGEPIPFAEVEALLRQRGPSTAPATDVQQRQMQLGALEMLIDDLLMQQFLRKHGPKVDPAEVSKRLRELEEGLRKQGKTLQEFYQETRQNEFQVRTGILNMLQWANYVKDRFNEADVQRYYKENLDFFNQVTVRASHIVLRVAPNGSEGERQVARAKLQALRQEVAAGKVDFAEAAKKHSQCPSAPNGGDIGYFPRKWVVEEPFARAAFALKVGDVSDVVQTDYGLHLIKVLDRKAGPPSEYSKIKDEVRELYVEEMRQALLAKERKASQIQVYLK